MACPTRGRFSGTMVWGCPVCTSILAKANGYRTSDQPRDLVSLVCLPDKIGNLNKLKILSLLSIEDVNVQAVRTKWDVERVGALAVFRTLRDIAMGEELLTDYATRPADFDPTETCEYCGKSYAKRITLSYHMSKHASIHPMVQCPDCPQKFCFAQQLVVHNQRFHNKADANAKGRAHLIQEEDWERQHYYYYYIISLLNHEIWTVMWERKRIPEIFYSAFLSMKIVCEKIWRNNQWCVCVYYIWE